MVNQGRVTGAGLVHGGSSGLYWTRISVFPQGQKKGPASFAGSIARTALLPKPYPPLSIITIAKVAVSAMKNALQGPLPWSKKPKKHHETTRYDCRQECQIIMEISSMHIIESGNVAAALGVKLARVQVIAAYPITPQTPLTEKLSEFVDAGEMDAEYVPVESEHSALAVCIAASSAGSRAFTGTSANGLLYMSEQVNWAAGARLPIVMCVVNRGIGAPWTIWNDQQDSMSQRDAGWIQLYACDHQQIIDTVIQAFHIAESVSIPVMVCYDGYILSHTYMPFEVPEAKAVDTFLPSYKPADALDPARPANLNPVTPPDLRPNIRGDLAPAYMEIRHNLHSDLCKSLDVVKAVDTKYCEAFGRGGFPYLERYRCDDADFIVCAMGSLSYQLRDVVDVLREEGTRVGVAGVRLYRPFPNEAMTECFSTAKGVIVFEKALSYGNQGPLAADIKAALYHCDKRPFVHNYILGLGGREIKTLDLIKTLRDSCTEGTENDDKPTWLGLKNVGT
jgi:pyruvate ferredoxin oxidoreductase alpha subunit